MLLSACQPPAFAQWKYTMAAYLSSGEPVNISCLYVFDGSAAVVLVNGKVATITTLASGITLACCI